MRLPGVQMIDLGMDVLFGKPPRMHRDAVRVKPRVDLVADLTGIGMDEALMRVEPEQLDQLSRAKAFIKQYGVEYTYLIAGAPVEMWEKVPQAVNLNTWPATLFVGRDGLVKAIHSGFAAPASGEFNLELKHEFTSIIEKLLADNAGGVTSTASSAKPALE